MLLAKTEQIRTIEEAAVATQGTGLFELMKRAGAAVADQAVMMAPPGGGVSIVCGSGNNGGDGFIAAGLLAGRGFQVEVAMTSSPADLKGPALQAYEKIADSTDIVKKPIEEFSGAGSGLVIDAVLGFGLNSPPRGRAADAIRAVNSAGVQVLAVDIPSGVDSDTGRTPGVAVTADRTVTFTVVKTGMAQWPGRGLCGLIRVADIGIDKKIVREHADICCGSRAMVRPLFPRRRPEQHKGDCGRVLVAAGSVGMTGAAALCGSAALKTGAGLVTLAVPESLNDILETKVTEVMTKPLPETKERTFSRKAAGPLIEAAASHDVLIVGPGLSVNEDIKALVLELIKNVDSTLVIDADGLNSIAETAKELGGRRAPTIITPHPGELARLLDLTPADIQNDRLDLAQRAADFFGATVVLKGAATVIADGTATYINPTGNPGMATAGTGDVLAGMIGGLSAQGLPPFPAGVLSVYLHGYAGDLAAEELSELALTAGDLLDYLPIAIKDLQRKRLDKDSC